jgi:hypothetical protein
MDADERLLESDGVVDVDMDRGVNRDVPGADPSITILICFRSDVEVCFPIVVITELMQMEAGRTAGDRGGLGKDGDGEDGQK